MATAAPISSRSAGSPSASPGIAIRARTGTAWPEAAVDSGFPVEFAILADLDNDGRAREVLPQFGDPKAPLAWYEAKNGTG